MKTIQQGHQFKIYDDGMIVHNQLPIQTYQANFDQMTGPYLSKYADITVNEKIYGIHNAKVQKVLSTFFAFNRNLGVILSGDKGIGKSLFSKLLAVEGIKRGLPLIVVSSYFPGIADYIASIEQEAIVIFDEFDKTFSKDAVGPLAQAEMLTLFDGLAQGKKLFVITCNEIHGLNDFLVNRPGRFHYHFRFQYPTPNEIREYLRDKLKEEYYNEIEKVVSFSTKVDLNYDCLRAIAFELNTGITFEEAILDLNIVNIQQDLFTVILHFESGARLINKNVPLDLFSTEESKMTFEDDNYDPFYVASFIPADVIWNNELGGNIIFANKIKLELCNWIKQSLEEEETRKSDESNEENSYFYHKKIENYTKPTHMQLIRKIPKGLHYLI